jgi:D-3-phosphoglycerate dehydrogenase / 2-oxoglutarate reductase
MAAAIELAIRVLPAAGANSQGVAELALALAIAAVRRIPWSDTQLKAGEWSRSTGLELAGRTIGIIGVGQIGRRLATIAAGIGMKVVGYDAFPDPRWVAVAGFEWSPLERVLASADVLSLHAPPGDWPLLDAARLWFRHELGNSHYDTAVAMANSAEIGILAIVTTNGN